jgi:hypothetical protein
VLAQYNNDNVNDYVDDDDDDNNNNNNNNNTELKLRQMAIPQYRKDTVVNCCKFLPLCVTKLH